MIEQEFKNHLMNYTSLTSVNVGYVKMLKDTPTPYATISKISSPRGLTHDGADGIAVTRLQVSVYSKTYAELKALCAELYAMHGTKSGNMSIIELANEVDLWDGQSDVLGTALDYIVRHYEQGEN